jgi:integrase/recombinase XerD
VTRNFYGGHCDPANTRKTLANSVATLLAIPFRRGAILRHSRPTPHRSPKDEIRITSSGGRKYLTIAERRRFLSAARWAPKRIRLFCLVLAWGGGRLSETLALTPAAIDLEGGLANFETLKRRKSGVVRQVPLPNWLLRKLDREFNIRRMQCDPELARRRLWSWSRTTGWRYVKKIMAAADIWGKAASPKGLRHTFGVASFQAAVPPHLVQRWLGHASLRTTAIYADVVGREERAFATRMWRGWSPSWHWRDWSVVAICVLAALLIAIVCAAFIWWLCRVVN